MFLNEGFLKIAIYGDMRTLDFYIYIFFLCWSKAYALMTFTFNYDHNISIKSLQRFTIRVLPVINFFPDKKSVLNKVNVANNDNAGIACHTLSKEIIRCILPRISQRRKHISGFGQNSFFYYNITIGKHFWCLQFRALTFISSFYIY